MPFAQMTIKTNGCSRPGRSIVIPANAGIQVEARERNSPIVSGAAPGPKLVNTGAALDSRVRGNDDVRPEIIYALERGKCPLPIGQ